MEVKEFYPKQSKPIQLHLGCYNKKIHGFINVDCREDINPDVVDDIKTLSKFNIESSSLILACHVLEHLDRKSVVEALKRWYDVLVPNGKVYICVPDMEAVFAHYFYWKDLKLIYSSLGGSQKHEADYHLSHFDETTLRELLETVGFKDVKRYDRWKTPWSYVDDYSAASEPFAYYPHREGLPVKTKSMSLNMEGTK